MDYSAEGTCGSQHCGQQEEHSSRNTQYPIDYLLLLFAAPISSIGSKQQNKNSNSLQEQKYASGHRLNLTSVSGG
jgi:hypothetical protein